MMKAQNAAVGILVRNDFGTSKYYQVVCGCGQEYHDHNVEVEAQDTGVNVNIYATVRSDSWSETIKKRYDIDNPIVQHLDWFFKGFINGVINRLKLTWQVWVHGEVKTETCLAMTEQQALNYAETLKKAIKDVQEFKADHKS